MNKLHLLNTVIARLEALLERAERARREAQADANSHLGRLQSRYDTFKEEAQYLAAAHERRISTLASWLQACRELRAQWVANPAELYPNTQKTVRVGSLVTCCRCTDSEISDPETIFILPGGFGDELADAPIDARPVSVDSPLARALLGHRQGEEVTTPAWSSPTTNGRAAGNQCDAGQNTRIYIIEVK